MSFGTTRALLRPERRAAEVLRYKSTSSHSFPKSNCSQEASVARLSADSQRFRFGKWKNGASGHPKTKKELSICEDLMTDKSKETVAVGVGYCLSAQVQTHNTN